MTFEKPRLMIAALRGGSGKTVVSLGLAAAWRLYKGLRVVPFKKGPDYIDAAWLSAAARHSCYNLDPFLMKPDEMLCSFLRRANKGDGAVIEGNRGLYDGVDVQGSYSTAELSKLLRAPVIIVLDATKVTRTAAALVLGCQHLDPEVGIAGVILNQVAGRRHERVLRGAIERYCRIPVLGVVPKESTNFFPERHLGLVPPQETGDISGAVEFAAARMKECIDLDALWDLASTAEPLGWPTRMADLQAGAGMRGPVSIGVIRDSAFQFYYPENIEALEERGAAIVEVNSLADRPLPDVDALYIGGGFPETHLERLSLNETFRRSLKDRIEIGLPVYAECGGLMYLCRGILQGGNAFPMTGVFPFDVVLGSRPQGHGYTVMECVRGNPFLGVGQSCKGHEFHYSRIIGPPRDFPFVFRLEKGHGIVAGWDGMCYKNVLASYSHIHAVGHDCWAEGLVRAALCFRQAKAHGPIDNEWTHEVCLESVVS
ncbi:MAG TPA: cobyrinate a,c-diamide synthase [Syntrophobacter fumaroxidans]|nr:cobyrinate a,c-diamide synthase [Syntrophobacter fumaroxidans]